MKVKVCLILMLMSVFLLTGCSLFGSPTPTESTPTLETETLTPTEPAVTPTPEVVVTEIYAKVSSDLYVSLNQDLNKNAIKVYAKYSDNTEKEITSEVSFSALDTSVAGVKELTITYQGFTTKVNVSVLNPTGVRLDYSNATTVFEVGQTINISNLIVYNVFGEVEHTANSFNITIKDPDGESINIGHTLTKPGTYTVSIRSNGFLGEYNVEVVSDDDTNVETSTPDELGVNRVYSVVSGMGIPVLVEGFIIDGLLLKEIYKETCGMQTVYEYSYNNDKKLTRLVVTSTMSGALIGEQDIAYEYNINNEAESTTISNTTGQFSKITFHSNGIVKEHCFWVDNQLRSKITYDENGRVISASDDFSSITNVIENNKVVESNINCFGTIIPVDVKYDGNNLIGLTHSGDEEFKQIFTYENGVVVKSTIETANETGDMIYITEFDENGLAQKSYLTVKNGELLVGESTTTYTYENNRIKETLIIAKEYDSLGRLVKTTTEKYDANGEMIEGFTEVIQY